MTNEEARKHLMEMFDVTEEDIAKLPYTPGDINEHQRIQVEALAELLGPYFNASKRRCGSATKRKSI